MRQQQRGEERRVIPFALSSGRERPPRAPEAERRGAILFFTGVRYERPAEPEDARQGATARCEPDPRS